MAHTDRDASDPDAGDTDAGDADPGRKAPPRDPGLAEERTQLAWNRSGLAALAAVAILLRRLWPLQGYRSVLALSFIGAGGTIWALGMNRARRHQGRSGQERPLGVANCRLLTIGTLVLATGGVLAALFPA